MAWARPSLVRGRWCRQTFGAGYFEAWDEQPDFDGDQFVSEAWKTLGYSDMGTIQACAELANGPDEG